MVNQVDRVRTAFRNVRPTGGRSPDNLLKLTQRCGVHHPLPASRGLRSEINIQISVVWYQFTRLVACPLHRRKSVGMAASFKVADQDLACFGPTHRRGFGRTPARDLPFIGSLLRHELQALVGPPSRHGMGGRTGLRLWQIKRIALAPNENSSLLKVGEELLLFEVGATGHR